MPHHQPPHCPTRKPLAALPNDGALPRTIATTCVRAGGEPDAHSAALVPAICTATTFAQELPGAPVPYCYGRTGNPTRSRLEQALAELEGAEHAFAFSSGLAAVDALIHTLESGAHIVASQDLYGGCHRQFTKLWSAFGLDVTFVDATDPVAVERALRPTTRLLWLESPSNPLLRVSPIAELAALAKKHGVKTVVDNTFATPILQQPLALGADLVLHSTTKYISGHCDVLGGALITNDRALAESIKYVQNAVGAVPSPIDAAQILRGIRTLHVRVERHCTTAARIAHALDELGGGVEVIYPGLPSHPAHLIAAAQMTAFGGLVTLRHPGGREAVNDFARRTRLWTLAESLGGFKSLWCHPPTMTHAAVEPAVRERIGISEGTIRLSVGLEDHRELLDDLTQALSLACGQRDRSAATPCHSTTREVAR